MFDYSSQITAFFDEEVKLSKEFLDKLYSHRKSNRDRLIARLPNEIDGISITENSFKPQGSVAVNTIIQTRFQEEEYDIDDGLVLSRAELIDEDGVELSHTEVREKIKKSLEDSRFNRQPKFCTNCVRVFYADDDDEKHHVDFAIYRRYETENGVVRELASVDEWIASDPTQINSWFLDQVTERNKLIDGKGSQLRVLIKLLKRFCRSRRDWDMPNGMKLTMLVTECQPSYSNRIDVAFYNLISKLKTRLHDSLIIKNLAHPDEPKITKTENDENVQNLRNKIDEAHDKLQILFDDCCDVIEARKAWDWVFRSDGFFDRFDGSSNQFSDGSIAKTTPSDPVDLRGGGRFGCQ